MASQHEHDVVNAVVELYAAVESIQAKEQREAARGAFEKLVAALGESGFCLRRGVELPAA